MVTNLPYFGGRTQKGKSNGGLDRRRYVDLKALAHKSSPVSLSSARYFPQARKRDKCERLVPEVSTTNYSVSCACWSYHEEGHDNAANRDDRGPCQSAATGLRLERNEFQGDSLPLIFPLRTAWSSKDLLAIHVDLLHAIGVAYPLCNQTVGRVGLCFRRKNLSSKNNAFHINDTVSNWDQYDRGASSLCNNAGIKILEGSELDERLPGSLFFFHGLGDWQMGANWPKTFPQTPQPISVMDGSIKAKRVHNDDNDRFQLNHEVGVGPYLGNSSPTAIDTNGSI